MTVLSFQNIETTIILAIFTVLIAWLAYKYWLIKEKRSDFIEIILLCVESLGLSLYGTIIDISGIRIALLVIFVETAIYLINLIVLAWVSLYDDV